MAFLKGLSPADVLALGCQGTDRQCSQRLLKSGFIIDKVSVRAGNGRGDASHTIWLARKSRG
jgi:hypothetical protein